MQRTREQRVLDSIANHLDEGAKMRGTGTAPTAQSDSQPTTHHGEQLNESLLTIRELRAMEIAWKSMSDILYSLNREEKFRVFDWLHSKLRDNT